MPPSKRRPAPGPKGKLVRYTAPGATTLRLPRELDAVERRFLDELMIDMEPPEAAIRAGLPNRSDGAALLKRTHVHHAFMARLRGRSDRVGVTQDYVLRRWLLLEQADPRELSEHWMVPCRHCWGHDHSYQFDDVELREATNAHRIRQMKLPEHERIEFDDQGGGGYTINRDPCRGPDYAEFMQRVASLRGKPEAEVETTCDHTCPKCHGHGVPHIVFHDTRKLSPTAALLYKGVRVTANGYEMMMRDQDAAREMIAKHQGYFIDRKMLVVSDVRQMSQKDLDAALSAQIEYLGAIPGVERVDVLDEASVGGEPAPEDA